MSKTITSDHNFPAVTNDLGANYVWQLWVLRIIKKKKTDLQLLYSWIVPSDSNRQGWQSISTELIDGVADKEGNNVRIEVLRADYICSGNDIRSYIDGLLAGKLLSEVNIDNNQMPNDVLNLGLGDNIHKISANYCIRPEVLLPLNHSLIPWAHKTTPNPGDYSIFVSQLFYEPKIDFLSFKGYNFTFDVHKKIITGLFYHMKKETGFDLSKESAPRIGNVEWFRLPASINNCESLISFGVNKTGLEKGTIVSVQFKPLTLKSKRILIRCRIFNGEEVSLDQIQQKDWSNIGLNMDFQSSQGATEILVTVWEKDPNTEQANIIFEKSSILIRQIKFNVGLIGKQFNTGGINLLSKIRGKDKEKVENLAKFSRSTLAGSSQIGGYENDPWVSSSNSVKNYMKTIFPVESKGQFFLNGWDGQKGQSGQLSFIEWIFNIISNDRKGGLILLDPYLDGDALEIFAHSRKANTQYTIVTCTQHREKEQTESEEEASNDQIGGNLTYHATEIANACKRQMPLLAGLDLVICDLRTTDGGKQAIFHDRYLLQTDEEGNVLEGYHLSNSLQGATKKAPLLVTPIPGDILHEVHRYVSTLISPTTAAPNAKKIETIQIYPFPEEIQSAQEMLRSSIDSQEGILNEIPNAASLFSILLNDPTLEGKDLSRITKYLLKVGIIKANGSNFLLYKINPAQLARFVAKLSERDQLQFNTIFLSLGDLLSQSVFNKDKANGANPYNVFSELCGQVKKHEELADKLLKFINTFETTHYLNDRTRNYTIFRGENFEQVILDTINRIDYMYGDFLNVGYSYQYACEILTKCFPAKAVTFLQDLISKAIEYNWNEGLPESRTNLLLVTTMTHYCLRFIDPNNLEAQSSLMKSDDFRLRAAASGSLIYGLSVSNPYYQLNFGDFESFLLQHLKHDEYRLSHACYIANQYPRYTAVEQTALFEKLLTNWNGTEDLVLRVIKILSGNLEFNRSYIISTNFLNPLIDHGKLTSKWCFDYWNKVFCQKISLTPAVTGTGSESMAYQFSETTDLQLTQTLLHYYLRLDDKEKLDILDAWIEMINPQMEIIFQPFAFHKGHNNFSRAANSIFWFQFLLQKITECQNLEEKVKNSISSFFDENEHDINCAKKYIEEESKYARIITLNELVFIGNN